MIWCCYDERQHLFCWSILAVFPESIALVVDSRESIVLPDGSNSIENDSLPIPSNITVLPFLTSIQTLRLWCLTLLRLRSFSNIIVVCYSLLILYQSFKKWFNFVQQRFANKNSVHQFFFQTMWHPNIKLLGIQP